MSEYIDRDAILRLIGTRPTSPTTEREDRLINAFISTVKSFPAADVREVVRGEWTEKDRESIFHGMEEHPILGCSKCNFRIYDILGTVREKYHFCPNCGADMKEK